jgi:hypothetical protein
VRRAAFLLRAITWWRIGALLHLMWILIVLFGLALVTPLANWLRAHHQGPLPGSSAEALAGNLLLLAVFVLFATGVLAVGFAGVLQWREHGIETRIKRGLCPQCAYPVGTSDKCTECGAAVSTLNAG